MELPFKGSKRRFCRGRRRWNGSWRAQLLFQKTTVNKDASPRAKGENGEKVRFDNGLKTDRGGVLSETLRVSIKLLLSGRPWRQEQAITAILCLLRVAKRVCLSSYSIRRDDLQEHQARLRDNKLHSRLWNRRKHSNSQLSKMFTLGLGIPKVGMPIGVSQLVGD